MNSRFAIHMTFASLLALCSTVPAYGQAVQPSLEGVGILQFREDVQVTDAVVRLGDLAMIRLADRDRETYLKSLVLYASPVSGVTRSIRSRQVHEELLLRNIDIEALKIQGASRIQVARVSTISKKRILSGLSINATEKDSEAIVDGESVVVLTRNIRRGERVDSRDVRVESVDAVKLRRIEPILDLDAIIGRQLTRSVNAKEAIDTSWVIEPKLVRRGSIVSVTVQVGGIRIRTTAKVQQDGSLHDIVIMESLEDRTKTLTGRVVGIDEVQILAQGSTYEPLPAIREVAVSPSSSAR
jgi:flagella basal body P-ring formation protein FlgA